MLGVAVAAGVVGLAMAWAIGAQDVSNSLATSVGSKAITINQALLIGGVFEFLGALMGGGVASTISTGIISPQSLHGDLDLFVRIMFSTLTGAFLWLAFATYASLPVSTTHSLVGSLIGLALLSAPPGALNHATVTHILLSWVTSPVFGCIWAYLVFSVISHMVLRQPRPAREAKRVLPFFFGLTFFVLSLFLTLKGPEMIRLPLQMALMSSSSVGVVAAMLVAISSRRGKFSPQGSPEKAANKPRVRLADNQPTDSNGVGGAFLTVSKVHNDKNSDVEDNEGSARLKALDSAERSFTSLMVLTACVLAFAHGSNDVSNAIGPFSAIVQICSQLEDAAESAEGTSLPIGEKSVPFWVLLFGGCGIVLGLATYGYKCMETIGNNITTLSFSRGFAAQMGTAVTVLAASLLGLSVSTTHCLIGSIAGITFVEGAELNKATLKKILLSWVVTMPASAAFSLLVFYLCPFLFSPLPANFTSDPKAPYILASSPELPLL